MDRARVSGPPGDDATSAALASGRRRSSETARIAAIAERFAGADPEGTRLGIGDDAALLDPGVGALVWTVDVQVEHVHFELGWLGYDTLGYRATMAALSDLGAMGARPRAVLSSLVLPASITDAELDALVRGQQRACERLGTSIVGGNLSRGSELSVTTTALGATDRALTRSGARAGERVWLAGPVGLAAAGLELLRHGFADELPLALDDLDAARPDARAIGGADESAGLAAEMRAALRAWACPLARIDAGLVASPVASAAIDLSDGLACDAGRVATASSAAGGPIAVVLDADSLVGAELRSLAPSVRRGEALPRSRALGTSGRPGPQLGRPALDLALHGGEDYALLVTAPPHAELAGFRPIGWCEARSPSAASLVLRWPDGRREPVAPGGYDHFG